MVIVDEFRFHKDLDVIIPWLAESKTTFFAISTAALKNESPCMKYLRRRWIHDDTKRVVRSLQMDSYGTLVSAPVESMATVQQIYKATIMRRLLRGDPLLPGESLLNGSVYLPWWLPAGDFNADLAAKQKKAQDAVEDFQYAQLEEYYRIARLPGHQDPFSAYLVKNLLGQDEHDREIGSVNGAGSIDKRVLAAFDAYSAQEWERRRQIRLETPMAILRKYMRPDVASELTVDTLASEPHRVADAIADYFFGQGTLENGRLPVIYIMIDPAGGGTRSDCVIHSFITRNPYTLAQKSAIQGSQRTWVNAELLFPFLDPSETLVR